MNAPGTINYFFFKSKGAIFNVTNSLANDVSFQTELPNLQFLNQGTANININKVSEFCNIYILLDEFLPVLCCIQ